MIANKPRSGRKGLKIGCCSCIALVALIAIILGALLPKIIENGIHTAVLKSIRIDPVEMKSDKLAKYLNNTTPVEFYIFNVTNLKLALTTGVPLNFEQVGPIKLVKNIVKYNVSWDIPNSKVSFKELTTYDVLDESLPMLSQKVVTLNPHFFGAAAATKQAATALSGKLNVDFQYVAENLLTGLFIGQVLTGSTTAPGVMAQFLNQRSDLIMSIRGLGLAFYLSYAQTFCGYVSPTCWNQTMTAWANGRTQPYLSLVSPSSFTGFELNSTLSAGVVANPIPIVTKLFDATNSYGIASVSGILAWSALASASTTAATKSAIMTAIVTTNGITPADVGVIGTWIGILTTTDPTTDPLTVGSAFMKSVCAAIGGALQAVVAGASPPSGQTVFQQMYGANLAAYTPKNWVEIAALQFGSGALVGIGLGTSTDFFSSAKGGSLSQIPGRPYVGLSSPMNFDDLASSTTYGQAEPMEFQNGIKYAATWVAPVTNPATALHLGITADLLYWNKSDTVLTLNINQSLALLNIIGTNAQNYIVLTAGVSTLVTTYVTTYTSALTAGIQAAMAGGAPDIATAQTMAKPTAIATAKGAVAYQISALPAFIASPPTGTCSDETTTRYGAALVVQAGVTSDNFYAYHLFLYGYLGNELGGTLSQLDVTGIAPQNAGMFTKRTVQDVLFGYNARFPGQAVPGVAGTYVNKYGPSTPDTFQRIMNEDYLLNKQGQDTIQNTGHADSEHIGEYYQFEGISKYKEWCDLDDPGRKYQCSTTAGETANNWNIYDEYEVVTGNTGGDYSAMFKEGDANILPSIGLYVTEAKRAFPLDYTGPTETKGVALRRYEVGPLLLSQRSETNPLKNTHKFKLSAVDDVLTPNGLASVQRANKGMPLLLSQPFYHYADASWNAGVTCTDPTTGVSGKQCQLLWNPDLHNTYLDYEPITGRAFNGHKRLQASMRVTAKEFYTGGAPCPATAVAGAVCPTVSCKLTSPQSGSYALYFNDSSLAATATDGFTTHYNHLFDSNRATLFFPWYWADLHDVINDDDAADFRDSKSKIDSARNTGKSLQYSGIIIGAIVFIVAIVSIVWLVKQK